MPAFGERSRNNLKTCHEDLQKLFNEVIKHFDCSVICGHRGQEEQMNIIPGFPGKPSGVFFLFCK